MIRASKPGDELAQAAIYHDLAGQFHVGSPIDARSRSSKRGAGTDSRLSLEVDGLVIGFITIANDGQISYPFCHTGSAGQEELWQSACNHLRERGHTSAYAVCRSNWEPAVRFFYEHCPRARQMYNFTLEAIEMPTLTIRKRRHFTPLTMHDLPALCALRPGMLRLTGTELERYWFHNAQFPIESMYAMRDTSSDNILAAGFLDSEPMGFDPTGTGGGEPILRLGAFGTEGLHAERCLGLFSFIAGEDIDLTAVGLDFLAHVAHLGGDFGVDCFAAQVSSEQPAYVQFYDRYFHRQGSFYMFEVPLTEPRP